MSMSLVAHKEGRFSLFCFLFGVVSGLLHSILACCIVCCELFHFSKAMTLKNVLTFRFAINKLHVDLEQIGARVITMQDNFDVCKVGKCYYQFEHFFVLQSGKWYYKVGQVL